MIAKRLVVALVRHLPQSLISHGWGWVARRRRPRWLVHHFKHFYARAMGFDLSEAEAPIDSYPTLEALFVRRLRRSARPLDPDPQAVLSPVDGTIGECGTVLDGLLLQVKGRSYSLARLLADPQQARAFEGGDYATFYLSPRDYHRIHAPVAGEVRQARVIPGGLMSVFPEALQQVDGVLASNERLVTYLDTPDAGRVAVVKVGAMLVGCITTTYDPGIGARRSSRVEHHCYSPPRTLRRGEELGAFRLGSTVVLIAEPGRVRLDLRPACKVRMGQRIGTLTRANATAAAHNDGRGQLPATLPDEP